MYTSYLPEQCLTPESIRNGARTAYEIFRRQSEDETLPDFDHLPADIKQKRETQFSAFAHRGPGANEPGDPFEKICAEIVRLAKENFTVATAETEEPKLIEGADEEPSGAQTEQVPSDEGEGGEEKSPESTTPADSPSA